MIPILSASPSNTSFAIGENGSLCISSFKNKFLGTFVLSYEERVNILSKVINDLGDSQEELSRKIIKIASSCGICLNSTDSEEAILAYLDRIIDGLENKPFLSKKIAEKTALFKFDITLDNSQEDRQAIIDEAVRKYQPMYCIEVLMPFTYELIRQGKIHLVLDKVVEVFGRCSIELQQESLRKVLEENPSQFIVELSTQLCSIESFLQNNSFEAVKYCFSHLQNLPVDVFIDCISRSGLVRYNYDHKRILLRDVFQAHYEKLCEFMIKDRVLNFYGFRVAFAEAVFDVNPIFLAKNFLFLFSESDFFLIDNFSILLQNIWNKLLNETDYHETTMSFYVKMVNLHYLRSFANPKRPEYIQRTDFEESIRQFHLESYSYQNLRLFVKAVFLPNYTKFITLVVKINVLNSLPIRAAFAEAVLEVNSDFLIIHFLQLFSEEEYFYDPEFAPLLQKIWSCLVCSVADRKTRYEKYVQLVDLYLQSWFDSPQLRTPGSERIKIMNQAKLEGVPISVDEKFSKDTPIWRHIGFNQTEDGMDQIFKLDWDFDISTLRSLYANENRIELQLTGLTPGLQELLYPALVVIKRNQFDSWWHKILGYQYYDYGSGKFMILPEPATIAKRWPNVLEDRRAKNVFKEFSVIETQGSVSVESFIELFDAFDALCSDDTEFVHDHQYHLLSTLEVIFKSTSDDYLNTLNMARRQIKHVQSRIKEEKRKSESSFDTTMMKVFELTLGIFADIYSIKIKLEDRKKYIEDVFSGDGVFRMWNNDNLVSWRSVFKQYNITTGAYPASRIQECWNQLIKSVPSDHPSTSESRSV